MTKGKAAKLHHQLFHSLCVKEKIHLFLALFPLKRAVTCPAGRLRAQVKLSVAKLAFEIHLCYDEDVLDGVALCHPNGNSRECKDYPRHSKGLEI